MLQVQVTCPGLTELGPWHASPSTTEPAFDAGDRPPFLDRSPPLRRLGVELDLGMSAALPEAAANHPEDTLS